MRIGIVTIYEPITNMGSFLQAYAMKEVLESKGHDVFFIENVPALKTAIKCVMRINPKREFLLRIEKSKKFLQDIKKIKRIPRKNMQHSGLDLIIYGSDEIWNMENPYFKDSFFFGDGADNIKKAAYAVSVGAMNNETLNQNLDKVKYLPQFNSILVRDIHTRDAISALLGRDYEIVCDPTLLVPVSRMSQKIKCPKEKYLLVYTYGLNKPMEERVVAYARKHNLKIVSPCFWHFWVDQVIECSALQFSTLIQNAECVFTSTFHGAIFTLLNHKRCCIWPAREKVRDVVSRLGEDVHIVEEDCAEGHFEKTMSIPVDVDSFEGKLSKIRDYSLTCLEEALKC